jgi:hypothetical protein
MHWLNNIAANSNLPVVKKSQYAIHDACKRLGLARLRVRIKRIDAERLAEPCQNGSSVTVANDQFPMGHVQDQQRIYVLDADALLEEEKFDD